jgi:hypothetical protein
MGVGDTGGGRVATLPHHDLHDLPHDHALAYAAGDGGIAPPAGEVDVCGRSPGGLVPEDGAGSGDPVDVDEGVELGHDGHPIALFGADGKLGALVCATGDDRRSRADRLVLAEALDLLVKDVAVLEADGRDASLLGLVWMRCGNLRSSSSAQAARHANRV